MSSPPTTPTADTATDSPAGLRPRPRRLPRLHLLLLTALGGALGSLARLGVNSALPWDAANFPWATFAENLTGSFLLGWLLVYLLTPRRASAEARAFLATGLLGSFTTFSALIGESVILSDNTPVLTGLYAAGSVVGGLFCAALGFLLGRRLHSASEGSSSDHEPQHQRWQDS